MSKLDYDLSTSLTAHTDRRTGVRDAIQHADQGKHPGENATLSALAKLMTCIFPSSAPSTTISNGSSAIGIGGIDHAEMRHYQYARRHLGIEHRILTDQPITFVSTEICDLINIAVSKMEADLLHESDLIAPEGFIYLARPLYQRDFHPVTGEYDDRALNAIRAISWHQEQIGLTHDGRNLGRGVVLTMYGDSGIARNVILPSLNRIKDEDGGDIRTNISLPDKETHLYASDIHAWAFGETWTVNPEADAKYFTSREDYTVTPVPVADIRKWFLAFMRFCWQELIVARKPDNTDISRQQRRAFERASKLADPISVVYLRRLHEQHDEPSTLGHSLTYRVLVRGHWRNQFYPSLGPVDDPMSHRRIWIDPHVKGPEHAPFRDAPKVTAVVR